jgi:hypothetical protein
VAEWFFELIDRLFALEPRSWVLVVGVTLLLAILVVLLFRLVRAIWRVALRARVCAEFGLSRSTREFGPDSDPSSRILKARMEAGVKSMVRRTSTKPHLGSRRCQRLSKTAVAPCVLRRAASAIDCLSASVNVWANE